MKKIIIQLVFLFMLTSVNLNAQDWESLDSGTDFILFDISFPPGQSEIGYAGGMQYTYDADGIVIKTDDGGDSWTQILPDAGTMDGIEAICFPSVEIGFIAGWNNYIAKTTDGGETWNNLDVGSEVYFFQDLEFWDVNNGVAAGFGGEIYVTNDGGSSWTSATGINQSVEDIAYASSSILYAVGGDEKISKSIDGGYTWTQIYTGTFQRYFMGVDFEGDFGVVGGEDGKIMHTNNGGVTWSTYATGYHNFQGVDVLDASTAYIGGTDEDIYKTSDGGTSWGVEYNGPGSSHIYKIKFTSDDVGFTCGSQGLLLRKAPALVAGFYADFTEVCEGDTVYFYNNSSASVTSWEWTFEGGYPESSTEENPMVIYYSAGSYDVQLSVSDGSETAELLMEDYIMVDNNPTPLIEGAEIVCDFQEEEYATSFVDGNAYSWEVVGGTIIEGEDTHMITVSWGGEGDGLVILTEINSFSCTSTDSLDILIDDCTLITDPSSGSIRIYPNPVMEFIHIQFENISSSPLKLTIANLTGSVVYKKEFVNNMANKSLNIDVENLEVGLYILQISNDEGYYTQDKFVKK